jgi:hypothetical protein
MRRRIPAGRTPPLDNRYREGKPAIPPRRGSVLAEIQPDATTGYDFSTLEEMLAWRDRQQ